MEPLTRKLKPMEDGKKERFAAAGSGVTASSSPPAALAWSSSSVPASSERCPSSASSGTRNPVRYQRDGGSGSTSASLPGASPGPTRSRRTASTSCERISTAVIGGFLVGDCRNGSSPCRLAIQDHDLPVRGRNHCPSGTVPMKRGESDVNALPCSFTRNLPPPGSCLRSAFRKIANGPVAGG